MIEFRLRNSCAERGCYSINFHSRECAKFRALARHIFFFLKKVLNILGQHKGSLVKVRSIIPSLDSSLIPSVRIKIFKRMILLTCKAKQPIACRAGRNMCLINSVYREHSVCLPVHSSAALFILIIEWTSMLINHDSIIVKSLRVEFYSNNCNCYIISGKRLAKYERFCGNSRCRHTL